MKIYETFYDSELCVNYNKSIINLKQNRNKIIFNIDNINKVREIVNIHINNFLEYFKKFRNFEIFMNFNKKSNIEVQANEFNIGIKFDKFMEKDIIDYICEYPNICYLEINNNVYKNEFFHEKINDILIKRNINTFHQNDDIVRNYLYEFIINNTNGVKNLILFGGEMYIFQNIIRHNNLYAFSDFRTIVEDTYLNNININNKIINLIDYSGFNLEKICRENSLTICNTSKNGLDINIAKQINSDNLIIISCNKKSFNKDYKVLSKKYDINMCLEINRISFYLLKYK
jgi:hypothetical protein